jgi:hypothetical protein
LAAFRWGARLPIGFAIAESPRRPPHVLGWLGARCNKSQSDLPCASELRWTHSMTHSSNAGDGDCNRARWSGSLAVLRVLALRVNDADVKSFIAPFETKFAPSVMSYARSLR